MHDGYEDLYDGGFEGSAVGDEFVATILEAPFRFVRWVWRQLRGR